MMSERNMEDDGGDEMAEDNIDEETDAIQRVSCIIYKRYYRFPVTL